MTDETNTPDPGIEDVDAQAPDTAEDYSYYDPEDDDQDTEDTSEEAATEDEAVEEEAAEEAEVESEAEADVKAVVTLGDGNKVTVAELAKGYLRASDYTRKTQEVATVRKTVEADAKRIESINQTFIDHLSGMVPAAPDSALALRDPNAYVRAKAQHEAAIAQVQKLIEIADQTKQVTSQISEAERQELIAEENRKLSDRIPEVATDQGRQKFFARAAEAANEMGFSMDELRGVTDHRMFVMAHYAKIGMEAMKARTVAKTKAQAAPPVAPRKPGQPVQVKGNADAMRKLARSGSIKDALKIDWD